MTQKADQARAELYDTLAQLRDRLDFAQRFDDKVASTKHRIAAEKRDNPLLFAFGVLSVAAATGAVVWGVTSRILRSRS